MTKDTPKRCCRTCRHDPGCLKKALIIFFLFIVTGRDQELSYDENGLVTSVSCPDWEGKET